VGEFDQPTVVAVIVVPATPVPDRETVPPLGRERVFGVTELEAVEVPDVPLAFVADIVKVYA